MRNQRLATIVLVAVMLVALVPVAASAQSTQGFQGTLTAGGAPVAGALVRAYDATTHLHVKGVLADSGGNYVLKGLSVGTYHLRFTSAADPTLNQFYDHVRPVDGATDLVLLAEQVQTISCDLTAWPAPVPTQSITGTLMATGTPVAGALVRAYDATTHLHVKGVNTNAAGEYVLTGLPVGSYHVRFTSTTNPSLNQYYEHKGASSLADLQIATTVTVNAGMSVGATSDLSARGCTIWGSVKQGDAVNPLWTNSSVYVLDAGTHAVVSRGYINALGGYRVWGLPAGKYHVQFGIPVPKPFYSDKNNVNAATDIQVGGTREVAFRADGTY